MGRRAVEGSLRSKKVGPLIGQPYRLPEKAVVNVGYNDPSTSLRCAQGDHAFCTFLNTEKPCQTKIA